MRFKQFCLCLGICAAVIFELFSCGKAGSPGNNNPPNNGTQLGSICNPTLPPFAGGTGSQASPFQITNFCHLYSLSMNPSYWSAYVQMGADLDFTGPSHGCYRRPA